jgi:hypothetical protein
VFVNWFSGNVRVGTISQLILHTLTGQLLLSAWPVVTKNSTSANGKLELPAWTGPLRRATAL